uniref:Uncharacterized protein n=1 Tax=Kalanchoe fedtschenkoi TaxID=63787 RepID=A0A7N0U131_KALFE
MFPAPDGNNSSSSNSFIVPYPDQPFLYSKLFDDIHIDTEYRNPYSPFSFLDQFHAHSPFFNSSDHHEQQPLEIQDSPFVQHHEEQQPVETTYYQEFTMAATSNNSASTGGYCTTENFHGNGFPGEPTSGNSSTSASVGPVKQHDAVRKNGILLKKDRHSKINTAQGPRDRRMRLSLDIAQRFFGLQDMLGFDKASKTVEWLLSKSQSEINKVVRSKKSDANNVKSDSFGASEYCEEVSEVDNKDDLSQSGAMDINKENKKSSSKQGKNNGKVSVSSRKDGFNHHVTKESREKARARARERTKEKMMICNPQSQTKQQNNNVHNFSNMDQNMLTQVKKQDLLNPEQHTYSYVDQGHMMTDQDESLANMYTTYWNPSSATVFNHLQQQNNGTSQQLQVGDIQFYARP